MATLFFNDRQMELNAAPSVWRVEEGLSPTGSPRFTNVVNTLARGAGYRNNVRVSIPYHLIGGARFWQVIAAGGDVGDIPPRTATRSPTRSTT